MSDRDVVLGYDGSPCAHAALTAAAAEAKLRGGEVVVAFGYGVNPMGGEVADHAEMLKGVGEGLVNEALAALEAAGATARAELVAERPVDALLHVAADVGSGLIVVGTHGESPLAGAMLGSVPHKLLHRSRIPVLVVPATD